MSAFSSHATQATASSQSYAHSSGVVAFQGSARGLPALLCTICRLCLHQQQHVVR